MSGVTVYVYTGGSIFVPFGTRKGIVVENLIIEVAKKLEIKPLTRNLFALKLYKDDIWLSPNQEISLEDNKQLEFRLRFKVPNIEKLLEIDAKAFDYYFHQCRNDFISGKIKTLLDKDEHCLGLTATDLLCKMRESNLTTDQVTKYYKSSSPKEIVSKYFLRPVKESIRKAVEKGDRNCERKDANFFKEQYLEKLFKIAPDYGCEVFNAFCLDSHTASVEIILKIDPYDEQKPGIQMKYVKSKKDWVHFCSFMDLCFITIRENDEVEINRKNGIPHFIRFSNYAQVYSFVSLLDGYYRLSEKFLFNLCCDMTTPSLLRLKAVKCHGPISTRFAHYKLKEKRQNKPGCYLLRQSDSEYDTYYLDVCAENTAAPVTYVIKCNLEDGKYFVTGLTKFFDSMEDLMRYYVRQKSLLNLQECLPPSEHDISDVHLCRSEVSYTNVPKVKEVSMCACISPQNIVFPNLHRLKGKFTHVKMAVWHKAEGTVNVAVKSLMTENNIVMLKEFMQTANKAAFCQNPAIVTIFGVILADPFSIVMEYFPLGPLNIFLQKNREQLSEVDLVEASTHIAKALWYLDEKDFFHGNICCRNVMVTKYSEKELKVKLSDAGLSANDPTRVHWLAVECYKNYAEKSIITDVWAYGTTLWEIFSFGEEPLKGVSIEEAMAIYKNGVCLSMPYGCPPDVSKLMKDCWILDPDSRIKPQAIMRDINQILLHVYNYYQGHRYSALKNSGYASPSLDLSQETITSRINSDADTDTLYDFWDIWKIDRECLELGKCLGKGNYGEVRKAVYNNCGVKQEVAVKQLKETSLSEGIDDLNQEINIMKPLDHPNIVQILGYCFTDSVHLLVMEFVPLGSLLAYLHVKKQEITHTQLLIYAINIVEGMKYLEEKKVVHRDLAARNILVASETQTKISDFGLARSLGDNNYYKQSSAKHIPAHWYAPECLLLKKFSSMGDVWSFGITLWEMFSYGQEPCFCPITTLIPTLQENKRLGCPADCPLKIYCIMKKCWEWDSCQRPTFVQLRDQLEDIDL